MRNLLPLLFLLAGCSAGGGNAVGNNQITIVGPVTPAPPSAPPAIPARPCVAPIEPGAERACQFGAQERLSGVWVRGFEQSNFLPGDTRVPEMGYARRDHYWLIFGNGVELDPAFRADFDKVQGTAAAAVEFVGRRAPATPHSSPVVIVDRIISTRVLGAVGAR